MAISKKTEVLEVPAPKLKTVTFTINGTAPLVMHKFSQKTIDTLKADMEAGGKKRTRSKKDPMDFDKAYKDAMHVAEDGWIGMPCSAFRAALISACRAAGIVMTRAKLAVFVEPDGFDATEGSGLVRIKGDPEKHFSHVRIGQGTTTIACRPMWRQWSADVRVRHDEDMISTQDVANLLQRAGLQVGIGEGRPDSKSSVGQSWGTFEVEGLESAGVAA